METTSPTPSDNEHANLSPYRDIPGAVGILGIAAAVTTAIVVVIRHVHAHHWTGAALAVVLGTASLTVLEAIRDAIDCWRGIAHYRAVPVYVESEDDELAEDAR
jgi:hypothetical protein